MATLTIFDVDDTLFKTAALVHVFLDGRKVYSLNSQELVDHKLKDGESYDFSQFKCSTMFVETATPIESMINEARKIVKKSGDPRSKAVIITARPWMDDMKKFIKVFHDHGLDIDEMNFHCVGDNNVVTTAEAKKFIVGTYLSDGEFDKVRIYEDNSENIHAFLELKRYKAFEHIEFEAYRVTSRGEVKRFV